MRTTLVLCLALAAAHAQAPAGRATRPAPPPPGYRVNPDRTVTFTLRAPDATIVSVSGDFTQTPLSMTKSADGAWIVTSAALRPALYNYAFTVNGVRVVDPANPMIGAADRSSGSSMFEVRADKPQPWDIQPVPHGAVHIQYYTSKKFETPRMIYIYTPPGYESTTTRYPALYLMHGAGGEESSWFAEGRANLILDNVIAGGNAKPMVVVMPYGRPGPAARPGLAPVATSQSEGVVFPNDVVEDVIPFAEKNYRISARADDRAIAGLSMGGNQTLEVGLTHLDTFHYIGAFSPVVFNQAAEQDFKEALVDPAATNKKLKLFYIYCGKTDTLFQSIQSFSDFLNQRHINHHFIETEEWHVWRNWRDYLADFTPRLFR